MNGSRIVMGGEGHDHFHCRKISWTAIFTGAFVGLGLSFLLNLFSIAIGLSVYSSTDTGTMSLAVGGLLGIVIGIVVAMFLGGFVAGYLGRWHCARRNLGVLYGFTTWSVTLIITALLTASVGRYVVSYSNFIANPATIIVTTDEAAPAYHPSNPKAHTIIVNDKATKTAANNLGLGAFLIFALFATSAFFSCLGGHCGMLCQEDESEHI